MCFLSRSWLVLCLTLTLCTTERTAPTPELEGHFSFHGYVTLHKQVGTITTMRVAELVEQSDYSEMIKALIEVESAWDCRAVSPVGALGLMQVMPATGRELKPDLKPKELLLSVELNVQLGIAILEDHMAFFAKRQNPEIWALTSYNRGRGGAYKVDRRPPSTKYSQLVLDLM